MEEDEWEGEGEVEIRDWAEMPSNVLFTVFGKLDVYDILTGVGRACSVWRWLTDSDAALWCLLDMTHHGDTLGTEEAEAMTHATVDRAAGTLQSFCADTFVTDALVTYISARSLATAPRSLFYTCHIVLLL
ncbi:hypothetical protein ZWY2020_033188 [Hordeum vulgare]|nr:hypothetical protein ZWY2020_033188 [Hordeum vulgare]